MTHIGKVYLVGAGPGDPKLITVRGMEALERADVVVYDRLASPRLLQRLKPGAEKIYVGKRTDRHTMKQDDINQLLVDLALQGKVVTRLKGGDPTIFGRVGEEAELLVEHGIEFEIVPGVTSATAVPAYAGIPVTHRDYASSIAIVTGHENPEKLDMNIKWDKLTPATDTMIFLMGIAKIEYIRDQLILHGKAPETPVALIRWGTRVNQQTLIGTLANIAEKVEEMNFKPPAVILVGEVVKLREKLNWYEKKPLFGRRVLVTRARSQASELAERIDDLGGEPYEFPVIDLRQPSDPAILEKLDQALQRIENYDWIMFTSSNGVEYFFLRMKQLGIDIRRMAKARIVAVGPKTEEALLNRGLLTSVVPASFYQAEGLLESMLPELKQGQKVLLPRADLARDYLPNQLLQLGLNVTNVDVYNNVVCSEGIEDLIPLLHRGDIHIVTFTSSSTVNNICRLLEEHTGGTAAQSLAEAKIACIGPVTAATIRSWGLQVDYMAEEATIDSLIKAIIHHNI
ncbi:MAG: uroporphyrinogen-III C-methyltransferase [Paenibacillaceae bacterium]